MSQTRPAPHLLSVVVPMYCEEEGLEVFLSTLDRALSVLGFQYEIVVVDDGSSDQTYEKLKREAAKNPHIRAVSLSRNKGHQIALLAGLDCARGQVVITMDGDLQHPPEHISAMVQQWMQGYDVVNMLKTSTQDRGWVKNQAAKFFYWIFNRVSSIEISPNGSDFRLLDRNVVEGIRASRQQQFFLRGIVADLGFRTCSLSYAAPERQYGEAKYTYGKLLDLALRGFFSYSTVGLRLPLYLGLGLLMICILNVGFALGKIALGYSVPQGWLSTFSLITLVFGVVLIFSGIQGFYISRIYKEIQSGPLYWIKADTSEIRE